MKNSNDTIGNRARDLPACNAVPQPTVLPRAPVIQCDRVIHPVTHNTHTVINTQLATCFGYSEPSAGQYLVY